MISYIDAIDMTVSLARGRLCPSQSANLDQALGRVLSETMLCPLSLPPFNNSAMDGYAVKSCETAASVRLQVVAEVPAGKTADFISGHPLISAAIFTGGVVPELFDAVVKQEEVHRTGNFIELSRPVKAGENIRFHGEDFQFGTVAVTVGTELTSSHLLALSALGFSQIPVFRRPRIGIISTGLELVQPGAVLKPGEIYNSSQMFLTSALGRYAEEIKYYGVIRDDASAFWKILERVQEDSIDLLITTGAVSVGKYDFVTSVLRDFGIHVHYHGVAIRPGKPILMGEKETLTVFGLPGNPISTVVGFRFFVYPYLRALRSQEAETPCYLKLAKSFSKPKNLRCFFKAKSDFSKGTVEVLPGQSSAMISPLLNSNAWACLFENRDFFPENEPIEVWKSYE